ncbi:unnamed protein product [Lampetra fluviatilis]
MCSRLIQQQQKAKSIRRARGVEVDGVALLLLQQLGHCRLSEDRHLFLVEIFACSNDPESEVVGSLVHLVGSPIAARSKGRFQT